VIPHEQTSLDRAATGEADATVVTWDGRSMGGHLGIRIAVGCRDPETAHAAGASVARRIEAWVARLTRFTDTSELAQLNASVRDAVEVGPTLGAVLRWGAEAERRTGGIVDVTLLDARLAAEDATQLGSPDVGHDAAARSRRKQTESWTIGPQRRAPVVHRRAGVRFDLDGVAKGWIADRALGLLDGWPAAIVDADGDVAIAAGPGTEWQVAIEDPFDRDAVPLATLHIRSVGPWRERLGVATSGTTVHRWAVGSGRPRHHLIDPRTGRPAASDLVQATVVAPSAAEAEILAKAAVILGSHAGAAFLDRSNASFGLLVREDGTTLEVSSDEKVAAA
jgi:thiamine biosynthesis lipoprotein